jgi:multidrug transporter EmrE-like cation transporter
MGCSKGNPFMLQFSVSNLSDGTAYSVVSGVGAVMESPYYQHEEQLKPWGDKNSKRK